MAKIALSMTSPIDEKHIKEKACSLGFSLLLRYVT